MALSPEHFISVVREASEQYRLAVWTGDKITSSFGRRTLDEIIHSGEIHYLCCNEMNLALAHAAACAGYDITLATAEIHRHLQPVKLGTALEFSLDGKTYHFTATHTSAIFDEGAVLPNEHKLRVLKAPFTDRHDYNWFSHFSMHADESIAIAFPAFNSSLFLATMRVLNSSFHYALLQRRRARQSIATTAHTHLVSVFHLPSV